MGIVQVAGVGILSVMLILCVKELRGGFAPPLRLASTLVLVGAALALYLPAVERIRTLFSVSGASEYAAAILRAAGIALICELSASFCRDLGENTVANGILLFGKLEILVLSLPLVDTVLEMARELLNF